MANFNKDYVKTSVFPREMGRKIGQAEEFIILAEKYCGEQIEELGLD